MPARLRMNVIGNPGIDKLDFELLSLAVSAINGCGSVWPRTRGRCASRGCARGRAERGAHRRDRPCGGAGAGGRAASLGTADGTQQAA